MKKNIKEFNRCIYCFEPKDKKSAACEACGYEDGVCDLPSKWLMPGTILKGRYLVGKHLEARENEQLYLAWDLNHDCKVEVTEFFPDSLVTRDVTASERVSCIPGRENTFEEGKQEFFEKAKLFYQCRKRVEDLKMDFFVQNETCYYVRKKNL